MSAKKKKPDLAVVIGMADGKKKPADSEPDMEKDPDGDEMAHEEAMGAMHDALKAGDMGAAVDAFRTLYDLCRADHESEGEGEYEGEEK
jgi:hypothetical protein